MDTHSEDCKDRVICLAVVLLFGASRLHLKIRDGPVLYKERVYGSKNISRSRHGLLLLRMTLVAARKLRFV